jgi:Holliday junction resolvase RusA-like endonuclease
MATSLNAKIAPVGKPRRTRRDKWARRPRVMAYRAFADALRASARAQRFTLPTSGARFSFFVEMPESWSKTKKELMAGKPHESRPDLDNMLKSVFDALLGEDCTVWHIADARKIWWWTSLIQIRTEVPAV